MKPKQIVKIMPKTLDEFHNWALANLNCDFSDTTNQKIYEVNLSNIFNSISEHPFIRGLQAQMEKWEKSYFDTTKSDLFMDRSLPRLLKKPYTSAVDKAFRTNILWNDDFPAPPKNGWVTPENLHFYFNDLVRCSIVCKFIDGPRFVTDGLMDYTESLGLERRRYTQERDEGYYAYHFYVKFPVRLVDKNWQETDSTIEAEIQVTTQLQEVLRSLTHNFYKAGRLLFDEDSSQWKWDFSSNRFRVGYLSHTLHLLESIILESRNQVADQRSNDRR